MYKNEDIPSNFNYIAEFSDNFVVWVNQSKLDNNIGYEAYIQYFKPFFQVIHINDYYITKGSEYTYNYDYNEDVSGSYLSSSEVNYSLKTSQVDDNNITFSPFAVADFPQIFVCQFIIVLVFLWVFKGLSRLFFKGGLS